VAAPDLEAEILKLRRRIAALTEEAATNERLLKKTQQRELELLKASELPQLFEVICDRLAVSYGLEVVTLLLWDPDHEIRHLLLGGQLQLEAFPNVIFADNVAGLLPQFQSSKKPWLGAYAAEQHRQLFPTAKQIKSLALIPLWRQDKLHGTLNFGCTDATRFTQQLGTDFFAHLGVIASFAVENAVNRTRLVRSGLTDFLTGWHNRRYLHERMKEELSRAYRSRSGVACVLLDLDHFKDINDRHGHLAGDIALREAANRVNQQIRGSDAAARFGGDEFVVLAPAVSEEQATLLAERMRQAVCAVPLQLAPGIDHQLTVSVGVALMHMDGTAVDLKSAAEQLLAEADAALYRAKQKGRNRVEVTVC
jgi:two-component system cell cycle response regulator